MFNPVSTYRLQFSEQFNFKNLLKLIPYLKSIGIKTIYASPVFRSVPGSTHGYDCTNLNQINPEIGTTEELLEIQRILDENNMYWMQDIVPNHMAYHHENEWLMDVMEKGTQSRYAEHFDIFWEKGKLMAPFLSDSLHEELNSGKIKLKQFEHRIVICYADTMCFPLRSSTYKEIDQIDSHLPAAIDRINEDKQLLKQIINAQHYQLVEWKTTSSSINYRRFFTVNGLICLNMKNDIAFKDVHESVLKLTAKSVFHALRIDHVDGLLDPGAYLQQLRKETGENVYLCVEKILARNEELPMKWPVQGTTGYDFLAAVNNLFITGEHKEQFLNYYNSLGYSNDLADASISSKRKILMEYMGGELENLAVLFAELFPPDDKPRLSEIKALLVELLVRIPVYRYYGNIPPVETKEISVLKDILQTIEIDHMELRSLISKTLVNFIQPLSEENADSKVTFFYMKFMQLSGPLMAKGIEDTLMYNYNAFIGNNEVGDQPGAFGMTSDEFHSFLLRRSEKWPLAINATATHDTKRGEDARARLAALTAIPELWIATVNRWRKNNAPYKKTHAPDLNDEYFIYQTLVATFPVLHELEDYNERLNEYVRKALRESKRNSSWENENKVYEESVALFIDSILSSSVFITSLRQLLEHIKGHAYQVSLSQLVLKYTVPGIPDTYRGTEYWDFSFVDPDNRRPVDYSVLQQNAKLLEQTKDKKLYDIINKAWQDPDTGTIKLILISVLLNYRNVHEDLFGKGIYIPLHIKGKNESDFFAFARRYDHEWLLVIVPLRKIKSSDTIMLALGEDMPAEYKDLFTGKIYKRSVELELNPNENLFPFFVLSGKREMNRRQAGILLPVFSLPSDFNIGDVGPAAYRFIKFLADSGQKIWQILPLNPTHNDCGHSPYNSFSAMAGNTLLISPDLLVEDLLLNKEEIEPYREVPCNTVDYLSAENCRNDLLLLAYKRYSSGDYISLKKEFEEFLRKEAYWLNSFIAFTCLSEKFQEPWYKWPVEFRVFSDSLVSDICANETFKWNFTAWKQFCFFRQWKKLRDYAKAYGIKILGDIPFYISYNSAEVWSDRTIFSVDEHGSMKGVAGVPPDYFSSTGQNWGMPTYNWDILKQNKYQWWINRMKRNLELFDLVRIDHFRAFSEYWEIPSVDSEGKDGKWIEGPGIDFFETLDDTLGKLPVVAEDLGYNMEKVYDLRRKTGLPGMKILQYGFGETFPQSPDTPHNFETNCIVYPGTHDNNTSVGWFRQEADEKTIQTLSVYTGKEITEKNIHELFVKMAYASVADYAITTMQDIVGLDETYRINIPGTSRNNWIWRLNPDFFDSERISFLLKITRFYNRY